MIGFSVMARFIETADVSKYITGRSLHEEFLAWIKWAGQVAAIPRLLDRHILVRGRARKAM